MNFNIKYNLFSFSKVAAVKQWRLGWTVAEASPSAAGLPQRDNQQKPAPGTYALLVGFGQRS